MVPEVVKYQIWNLAIRMNAQTATLKVRTSTTTPGGEDTFTSYDLLRVTYRELTNEEMQMAGVALGDVWRVWCIYQVDLDQSGAPVPQISFELNMADGTNWTIERVYAVAMNQAFECTCRLMR